MPKQAMAGVIKIARENIERVFQYRTFFFRQYRRESTRSIAACDKLFATYRQSRITKLEEAGQALFAAAQAGGAQPGAGASQQAPGGGASPEDVVDAEFTEVKGDEKK